MKNTINTKVYDTDKAKLVAEDGSKTFGHDSHAWKEKLYVTRKGTWFLHGWGAELTEYAERDSQNLSPGESIIPMTREEALAWCEEHRAQEAIDTHFSDMIEEA